MIKKTIKIKEEKPAFEIGYIKKRSITEEMKESYLDYAMSVIVSRALPDVRDGLKPVHRRILYAMHSMGLASGGKHRKSAAVVGDVLGKYHPHGDMAVYEAMVRMAQDFSLRYPLVNGQGNFGCFTKETKVRLTDGRSLSFGDLVKEAKKGKRNWTFSFNSKNKEIEIAEIKNPRLTRKKEKIMEVTLDNKEKIRCTLDHLFMLRNGLYKKAKDLKPSDSLMPFHVKFHQGKETNLKNYFDSLSEIIVESKKYNHRIINTRILRKREDVYDLTISPYHNFSLDAGIFVHNSMDGDSAAASRYTEAKMSRISEEMMVDIEKESIDWIDNYDGTRQEPSVLPAKFPQLLVNGIFGIAVGMTTNIPPHNLGEIIDATIHLIEHPKATVKDLFEFVKGPDFPTGGEIYDKKTMIQTYSTGRGPIVNRAKAEIVESKTGRYQIIVNEMTYGTNKATLIAKIADLYKAKKLQGIKDVRDESDKDGVRVVVDIKSDASPQKILNRLFKLTDLQKTFHMNMLALVDRGLQPQILSLVGVLEEYTKHRQEVITRRTKYLLKKAKERAHILEGLNKALDYIDAVINIIKKSPTREEAHQNLMKKFKLSDLQSTAILEMRLQTLAGLEQKKIKDELKEKKKIIKELESLLISPRKILTIIKNELKEIKDKFADARKTKVYNKPIGTLSDEDLISKEECIVMLTQGGYIKRVNPQEYKTQKRGGKGIIGITPREEDAVGWFLSSSTHDNLLFFTDQGRVFQTKAYEIPEASRIARGKAIVNILQLSAKEQVAAVLKMEENKEDKYLVMSTENGIIKRTKIEDFVNVRRNGLMAIKLKKNDKLKWAKLTSGGDEILLVTVHGQSIRFKETDVRSMGRSASGVKGIRLKKDDKLIRMDIINKEEDKNTQQVLIVTENGFGKKTFLKNYKQQKRGGSGIKTAKLTEKTGNIVASYVLKPEQEDLIAISKKGQVIRTNLKSVATLGRSTQGVRIMKMNREDKVVSIACI